jgi:putative ABC transport system permease protein
MNRVSGVFAALVADPTRTLVVLTLVLVGLLGALGLRAPHLVRIGVRNVGRRRLRTGLIIFGLMLSTTFVAAALAVDDTITLAVKTVAVFNLGRVDEDVLGGSGQLGLYSSSVGGDMVAALRGSGEVAGVAPTLRVPDLLVADTTARQVRSGVAALGMDAADAGPLANLRAAHNVPASPDALASDELYLNTNVAKLLSAQPGDTIQLYSALWPRHRYQFRVKAIVSGGPLGDTPQLVVPLDQLQHMAGAPSAINHVYVANSGDGLSGVAYSDDVADQMWKALPDGLRVDTVKADGVRFAVQAQDVFSRILTLFTLFALSIGLLLIFLIFVLLAAERRAELGMTRALGMRRDGVVLALLFEGAAYDVLAAALGILAGLGLGVLLVVLLSPTITRIGFPLSVSIAPSSVVVAFCLGFVFTLATIWLAAWTVSSMTIAAALRDLPEPPAPQPTLARLVRTALVSVLPAEFPARRVPTRALGAWLALFSALVARGWLLMLAGWWLMRRAAGQESGFLFSVGLSVLIVGLALALRALALWCVGLWVRLSRRPNGLWVVARATLIVNRLTTTLVGVGLALYWSLPVDVLQNVGVPRFTGGIQIFFVAGVMMVFGAVWAVAPNLDLLLAPLGWVLDLLGRLRHVTRIALVYPSHHRFRTGVGLSLFSLICFTMVVMACIAASTTQGYDNVPAQAAGYDVVGQPLFAPIGGISQVQRAIQRGAPTAAGQITAVSAATSLPIGIIQPGAPNAQWGLYPAAEVQGAFLDGVGLPLAGRASGFSSDAAVWADVRSHPGDVVIDAGALIPADRAALGAIKPSQSLTATQFVAPPITASLPTVATLDSPAGPFASQSPIAGAPASQSLGNLRTWQIGRSGLLAGIGGAVADPGALREFSLHLNGIVTGPGQIAPTPVWVVDARGGHAVKLNIVGIVDNSAGQRYGLLGSPDTFAPVEQGLPTFGNQYYYFKLTPLADAHAAERAISAALSDYGFEASVLQDVLLDVNGPRVFISRVIVGLVGLTLLVGIAALAVTGSRAVVERRQQIGMLRALGYRRRHVQAIFLLESLLVGVAGTAVGLALGLVLCRNVFAVDFFSQFQSGLTLVVPWRDLATICAASVLASMIAALLPAWQAGRVAPADALRYE